MHDYMPLLMLQSEAVFVLHLMARVYLTSLFINRSLALTSFLTDT